jgi:hypothetical protein
MPQKNKPSRFAIARYWAEHEHRFVIDLGEPSCFACGYWNERWDDRKTASERWNRARLERAHIIADSIGGSCEISNFLLLCRKCHQEAPMTNSRDLMLAWARNREAYISRLFRESQFTVSNVGITEQDLEKYSGLNDQVFLRKFKQHLKRLRFDRHPHQFGLMGDCDATAWILKDFISQQSDGR